MKHNLIVVLTIALQLTVFGCASSIKSDFVVDGSTEASTSMSVGKIIDSLEGNEREKFMIALVRINYADITGDEFLRQTNQDNPSLNFDSLGSKIDGMNYYQILALANKSSTKVKVH
ncbi:hypothetical protein LP316_14220 [Thalassotalea sp. LPB0316]|uniref:DUF6694 family lipoprotein n=1 Tax=Thalassotalea sp. LPB0316 TaxID=2769490 RepID=UPI0018692550|nr:DUF6694 family lipoprotein [Thalassotalea sp. LPB0316]QOL25435.1 hypothetical protein LP316_14220 [Thalassotalea sp. LPB0316]